MSLEKIITIDQIEIIENGSVQVRTATKIMDDGKEISRTFCRHVIAPGQDYSAENDRVRSVCAAVQTVDVIAAYEAAQVALDEPAV